MKKKYQILLPVSSIIIHIDEKKLKKARKLAIQSAKATIGYLTEINSRYPPQYLGRGNWKIFLKAAKIGKPVLAEYPEEAIEIISQRFGLRPEDLEAKEVR